MSAKFFKRGHPQSFVLAKLLKACHLENFLPVNFLNKLENKENISKLSGNNNGGVFFI